MNPVKNQLRPYHPVIVFGSLLLLSLPANAQTERQFTQAKLENGVTALFDESKPDGYQFVGQIINSRLRVMIERRVAGEARFVVYSGTCRYIAYDESIPEQWADAGETFKGYNFHLDSSKRWLFVERPISVGFCAALLYHRKSALSRTFTSVRPKGSRFDVAAIRYLACLRHISANRLRQGARNVIFQNWDGRATELRFSIFASSTYEKGVGRTGMTGILEAEAYMSFDLSKGTFRIVKRWL